MSKLVNGSIVKSKLDGSKYKVAIKESVLEGLYVSLTNLDDPTNTVVTTFNSVLRNYDVL